MYDNTVKEIEFVPIPHVKCVWQVIHGEAKIVSDVDDPKISRVFFCVELFINDT